MNLRVVEIFEETHDTKTFYMEDADEGGRPYDFIAGQYLTFRFDTVAEKPVVRSYTMSGSPCMADRSIFTVKRIPHGLISNWLCDEVKEGDILRARGPIGMFVWYPDKDATNLAMIAGGSGVTPFISIIREHAPHLGKAGSPTTLSLLVAYRSKLDLICWREIEELRAFPGVRIEVALTREDATGEGFWQGRPDEAMIARFFDGRYDNTTVMTCGPIPLMELTSSHCLRHGMAPERVKTESFES
jgi:ferredoxin-NADP reductase